MSSNAYMLSQVRSEAGKVRRPDGSVAKSGVNGLLACCPSSEKVKKSLRALFTFIRSQSDSKVPLQKCRRSRLLLNHFGVHKALSHFYAFWLTGWVKKLESALCTPYPITL